MNFIKGLIRYFLWILLFILSYIIPKKKWLYVFGWINWKTFSWNSKAMFLYFLFNDRNKEIYYHIRNKKVIDYLNNNFSFLKWKIININSLKWF